MATDEEIAKLCMQRYHQIDTATQEIQSEREKSLDEYHMQPYGDEIDGMSDFVASDVMDTVEWILPQLIEMFIGPESPGSFRANGEEDAESARTETEYVRYVYNEQNEGFLNTYTWFKDALIQKNGIVMSWWDEKVEELSETYDNRTFEQYLALAADDDIEIDAVTVMVEDEELSLEDAGRRFGVSFDREEITDISKLAGMSEAKFNIEATRKEENSQAQIDTVAPEKFFVDTGHPSLSLSDCNFCGHWEILQENDLIIDGYDEALIKDIPTSSETLDPEVQSRNENQGPMITSVTQSSRARPLKVWQFYIRDDLDESGKSQLWSVKLGGDEGTVLLEKEPADSVPYNAITPIINTHRFHGKSVADLVRDIQKLRSRLWRGALDNLALTNAPVLEVDPSRVNTEDLLYRGPGSTIRTKAPGQGIFVQSVPFTAASSLETMSLVDEMRQERTGVSSQSQGLDVKALADSTNLVGPMIMSQALLRIKMIARIFAEAGFKPLMVRLHELISKNETAERVFEVAGDFVTTDPRSWAKRSDYRIRVGVGHVDAMQRVQAISSILSNHKEILVSTGFENPLVSPENFHEALVEQAKLLGYPDGAKFYRDPKTYNPPPQEDPIDEAIEVEKAKALGDVQKESVKQQVDLKKHDDDLTFKREQLAQDRELKIMEMERDERLKKDEMLLKYGPTKDT